MMAQASPHIPEAVASACGFDGSQEIGERDVVVVNDPTFVSIVVPFDRAYRGRPLPKSLRTLVPGTRRIEVTRADASTLVLKAKEGDLFDCPEVGPVRSCYVCKGANEFLFGGKTWTTGERVRRKGLLVEVREVSPRGAPQVVAFHFDRPLESDELTWLFFDWRKRVHRPFDLPQVGETVEIVGPRDNEIQNPKSEDRMKPETEVRSRSI